MLEKNVGKIVLIRSYASGVHFGELVAFDADKNGSYTVDLKNSRRVHYWEGAASLSQVAVDGIKSGRVAMQLPELTVMQVIETIPLSEAALSNLSDQAVWKM